MKDILRELGKDPFNDGIAKRITRESRRAAFFKMDAREQEARREATISPWIKTVDRNIMKPDILPERPPQKPSR